MKLVSKLAVLCFFTGVISHAFALPVKKTAFDFNFPAINGKEQIDLSSYKGKVVLVVNTASHCALTGQYEGLEELYKQYKDKGFTVIGVPSNDFYQEPASGDKIQKFCKLNFGVTFPLTQKQVVTGKQAHPFYLWANEQAGFLGRPKWNFHKYLIGKDGRLIDWFSSATSPKNKKLASKIEGALSE